MDRVPYVNVVGSVMDAMVCYRPDIAFAISQVSRYMSNLGKKTLGGSKMCHAILEWYQESVHLLQKQRSMCRRLHGC